MSLCGCYPQCSCKLSAGPSGLLDLTGNGDPLGTGWVLTANETTFSASNADGAVDITPGGSYGHEPQIDLKLDNTGNVELTTSANGLQANVVSLPPGAGGVPPGVSLSYHGTSAPAGYLMEYGQLVDIATYPDLFAAIGHVGNGGVDPGGGQFRIPDGRGLVDVGKDDMGGVAAGNVTGATVLGATGGSEDAQLGVNELPAHTHTETGSHSHPVNDSGHGHPASSALDGAHAHQPGTGDRAFVVVGSNSTGIGLTNDAPDDLVVRVTNVASPGAGSGGLGLNTQGANVFTSTDGAHTHAITITSNTTGITVGQNTDLVTVGGGGNGAAFGNAFLILQPYRVVNKIIKT